MYKNIILLFSFLLFISLTSSAQDCDNDLLIYKPGQWKAGQQGQIVNVKAVDLVKEKAVITAIHKMVSGNYKPTGCQIAYSTVFGKPAIEGQTFIADPYHYTMYVLRYFCDQQSKDKSKYYVAIATPTTVNITANAMYWLNVLFAANLQPNDFRGYLKIERIPVKKDGFYFIAQDVDGGPLENKIRQYRWLITYNDSLPFSYVSRKEYLLIQKKRLEKAVKENPSDMAYNAQYLDNISNYLAQPESELSLPAICMWNDEERFAGFVEEGTRGSFIAVKPNLAYFRRNLPKSTPQFFTVEYKIEHGDPIFEENIANIKKAVDFTKLRNMLGK